MSLDNVIKEYYNETFSENDEAGNKIFDFLQEHCKTEDERDNISSLVIQSVYYMFSQGFIQGVAATKGGAV